MAGRNLFADLVVEEETPDSIGINLFTNNPPPQVVDEVVEQTPVVDADTGQEVSPAGQAILDIPGGAAISEFASAVNRGVVDILDFISTDQINAVLELSGSETRIPAIKDIPLVEEATTGDFMEPGLAKEAVRTAGEFVGPTGVIGQTIRTAAKQVPKLAALTTRQRVTQSLASEPLPELTFGAISGAGAEIGEDIGGDIGGFVGAIAAPIGVSTAKNAVKGLINAGKRGIEALMKPLSKMSEDGASTLLAEAMVREGMTPNDVVKRLNELGPEAIPADLGNNFARLLRTASNKIPSIEGRATVVLKERHSGQGARILKSLDDATETGALTVDDAIQTLSTKLKPEIDKLYSEAGKQGVNLSDKVRALLEGPSSVGKALKKAQIRLADKRAAGDEITNINIIDATKQELDDQIGLAIRQGEKNKVRDLVRLKNVLIDEVDKSVPIYKKARDLFAGKAALESSASSGELFLKMNPSEIARLTKSYGKSESAMFKLGAKKAILNKIDDLQSNADAVRRLFGKNGDVKKLRSLFDNDKSFNKFSDTLKRESDFIMTRRAAQANSTTAKQLSDDESALNVLSNAAKAVSTPSGAANFINKIINGLGKGNQDKIFIESLEKAGDLLLIKGIEPQRIQSILLKGSAKQIEIQLKKAMDKKTLTNFQAATIVGGVTEGSKE